MSKKRISFGRIPDEGIFPPRAREMLSEPEGPRYPVTVTVRFGRPGTDDAYDVVFRAAGATGRTPSAYMRERILQSAQADLRRRGMG